MSRGDVYPAKCGVLACVALVALALAGVQSSAHALRGVPAIKLVLDGQEAALPVSSGTRTVSHPPVELEERSGRLIELVDDVVFANDPDVSPEAVLAIPEDIAVGENSMVFVVDAQQRKVQTYDSDGGYLGSIGRPGEGPGEFSRDVGDATVAGGFLYVNGGHHRTVSVWDTKRRELVGEISGPGAGARYSNLYGLSDGTVVAVRREIGPPEPGSDQRLSVSGRGVVRLDKDGAVLNEYVSVRLPPTVVFLEPRTKMWQPLPDLAAKLSVAVSPEGMVYVADPLNYELLALDATGEARWFLSVPYPRREVSDADLDAALARVQRLFRVNRSDVQKFTDQVPAIDRLAVDGRGYLYVFHELRPSEKEQSHRPVDVYDSNGELVFAGLVENSYRSFWYTAFEDDVFGLGVDEDTDEEVVVRRRLVAPYLH